MNVLRVFNTVLQVVPLGVLTLSALYGNTFVTEHAERVDSAYASQIAMTERALAETLIANLAYGTYILIVIKRPASFQWKSFGATIFSTVAAIPLVLTSGVGLFLGVFGIYLCWKKRTWRRTGGSPNNRQ